MKGVAVRIMSQGKLVGELTLLPGEKRTTLELERPTTFDSAELYTEDDEERQ